MPDHTRDRLGICSTCGEGITARDIVDGETPCPGSDPVLEVVRAAQANEVAAVVMAATDEAWLPLSVRYGVADRLWELGYRKVSDEARQRGHEWMRTVTERVNRGEVAEVIDTAEAVISLLLGVAQPVTREQIIAMFAESEPVAPISVRSVSIGPDGQGLGNIEVEP